MKEMEVGHWLFLPDDALDDLETLAKLSSQQTDRLGSLLDSSEVRPKYDFFVKVATLLGVGDETAAKLCTFISYVQRQREKHNKTGEAVLHELDRFLKNAVEGKQGEQARRIIDILWEKNPQLTKLFSELPTYDFSQKVQGLETGPLPHLKSFRAFCDLRPVYDAKADAIIKSFPVITLCLVTHSSGTDESKEVLVQLTETDLDDFSEQFARLRKKLDKLKMSNPLGTKKE
jgi:hypothetical protein